MWSKEYVPCDKQIHIKIPEVELQMIRDRMAQMGFRNLSAYVRKMVTTLMLSLRNFLR